MTRLGIFSWFSYPGPIEERLKKIKLAGFDATSLWWDIAGDDKDMLPDLARKTGLEIDNIHAPFFSPIDPNSFWTDKTAGEDYFNVLISCIDDCKKHDIPSMVIHITDFLKIPPVTELGLDRVKRLAEHAEKQGINLAFENLNTSDHLDCIFQSVDSSRVGFCYDSGHENCSRPGTDYLSQYGDRLFAVHLHDNFGDDDTHLLPYDGTVNWNNLKKRLAGCRELDYMTFEVCFNPNHEKSILYKDMSADDFLALAYKRAERFLAEI